MTMLTNRRLTCKIRHVAWWLMWLYNLKDPDICLSTVPSPHPESIIFYVLVYSNSSIIGFTMLVGVSQTIHRSCHRSGFLQARINNLARHLGHLAYEPLNHLSGLSDAQRKGDLLEVLKFFSDRLSAHSNSQQWPFRHLVRSKYLQGLVRVKPGFWRQGLQSSSSSTLSILLKYARWHLQEGPPARCESVLSVI